MGGWIAAGIVAFLLFLLLWPAEWRFSYKDTFSAEVRWLFLRFPLTDRAEKKPQKAKSPSSPKPKKKSSLSAKVAEFERSLGAENLPQAIEHLTVLLKDIAKRTARLLRHSTLSHLEVSLEVGGTDAADTAMLYGTVCAAVYPLIAWGVGLFRRAKQPKVNVTCSFETPQTTAFFELWMRVTPLGMLAAGLGWIFTYIKLQNKTNPKEEPTQ